MKLAYAAGRAGGTMTGVMSAANEQVWGVDVEGGLHVTVCIALLPVGAMGPSALPSIKHAGCLCCLPHAAAPKRTLRLTPPHPPPHTPPKPTLCQAVEMFIQERIHYLDIVRLAEECCEAHRKELVEAPSLEDIVHYDQ